MTEAINIKNHERRGPGLVLSVLVHLLVIAAFTFYMNTSFMTSLGGGGGYMEVSTESGSSESTQEQEVTPAEKTITERVPSPELVEKVAADKNKILDKTNNSPESKKPPEVMNSQVNAKTSGSGKYMGFSTGAGDTTGLQQVYAEKSLNVRINYPTGWTFLDQDKRNKLDGVTFWENNGIFDPPPYIFLEVKEKYSFNPSQFKYNSPIRNAVIYYNDPEELENQVSQVFYFRTEEDEDFSIKLIMTGRDSFSAFQPVFFGMIKTFKFGRSWF